MADLVPYMRPALPPVDRVLRLVGEIWDRGIVTNDGPVLHQFERALTDRLGWPSTAVVRNGTTAIQLLLGSIGVGSDADRDEVVVSNFTHPATIQALRAAGGRPVTADIEERTLTADADSVRSLLTARTAALLITHPFGLAADVDALERIALLHEVPIVFDAAAAVGVHLHGRPLTEAGSGSAVSMHATKLLCAVEAGAVTSRDAALVARVRLLRNFGIREPNADPAGTNGKADELVSAVGLAALEVLDAEVAARADRVRLYRELLDLPWISVVEQRSGATASVAAFAVRLRSRTGHPLAARVANALIQQGIEARRYFAGPYALPPSTRDAPTPVADRAREEVLCLPLWGSMSSATIERVATAVREAGRD